MCARNGKKRVCRGDSGGPVVTDVHGNYIQTGLARCFNFHVTAKIYICKHRKLIKFFMPKEL